MYKIPQLVILSQLFLKLKENHIMYEFTLEYKEIYLWSHTMLFHYLRI